VFCASAVITEFSSTAEARIGDARESIERRLFASGGIVYRDDAMEATRRRGMPYMQYFELLSGSADVRIYFKTADGRRPTSSELEDRKVLAGWDLHVVYVNGKSAIEVYKRSQGMSEFEFNQLLALHAGGSFWKKLKKGVEAEPSAFGYDMFRDDGVVRGKKLGNDRVMFFDARIDQSLAEMNASDLLEKAPLSVSGF
jgi:hypothetical protein